MTSYFRPFNRNGDEHDTAPPNTQNDSTTLHTPSVPNMITSSSSGADTSFGSAGSPYSPELEKPELFRRPTARGDVPVVGYGPGGHGKESSGATGLSTGHSSYRSGPNRKNIRKAPFLSTPVKGTEEMWLERDHEAVEWLSLFYDLVVVAVLTIFSTQHELATPAAIPIFLSFFIIIFWTWVSQTAYDMRYQGNDAVNRFFKFIQIGLFIYQGAAGGNWNPGKIQLIDDSGDPYGYRTSQHQDALQAFTTVAVAFAVSRVFLIVQYGICLIQGRRAGRQVSHIGVNMAGLLASMTLAVISFCIPATSSAWKVAKIVLFYSGIGVEVINVFVGVILRTQPPLETHKVAERYGAFTLIILGEGIISVTRAFSRAISGLSNDDDGTYIQVFLTILILFLLYSFLFGTFDKNDHTGHGRAIVWQMVHFPLCFCMLLFVAAMVNVVVTLTSTHGISRILDLLEPYSNAVYGAGSTYLDPEHLRVTSKYMNKLSLEPPFAQTMNQIYGYLNQTTPDVDPQVAYVQYAAQIGYSAYQAYGVEIPIEATNMYYTLYGLNTTWQTDVKERAHLREEAGHMFTEIIQEILNDSFTGVLWLLPVSGCVLVLTAIRSMLWYRFLGAAHWIYHGSQIVAGVCLGLLGLLDIGPKHLDIAHLDEQLELAGKINPLYRVLVKEIPLAIIAGVYLVVYVGSGAAIWIVQRRQDKKDAANGENAPGGQRGLGVEVDPESLPMTERR